MEQCQPANQDTPSNVRDTTLSVLRFGTWSAETIRASGRVCHANRPDTRLHLTDAHISSKNVLLCRRHPHRTFAAFKFTRTETAFSPRLDPTTQTRTKRELAVIECTSAFLRFSDIRFWMPHIAKVQPAPSAFRIKATSRVTKIQEAVAR